MSDRYQLAIESSSARASVALACAGELVYEDEADGSKPSEVLLELLRGAVDQRVAGDIELVVIGTGPGSYNGARVGIAAGQGVAVVHGCPAVGLSSLEGVSAVRNGGACLAVGDARRGHYFALELYDGRLSSGPDLMEHGAFVAAVRAAAESGSSLLSLEEVDRLKLGPDLGPQVELVIPTARLLLEAWERRSGGEKETALAIPPEPYYLRPPHITKAGERGRGSGVV